MTPMTPTELNALAEKVAALEGPCREVDADVAAAIRWSPAGIDERLFFNEEIRPLYAHRVPRYTASLDAAMGLVPDGSVWFVGNSDDPSPLIWNACVMPERAPADRWMRAATPALALCAAAIRARASAAPVIGGGE